MVLWLKSQEQGITRLEKTSPVGAISEKLMVISSLPLASPNIEGGGQGGLHLGPPKA